MADGDVVELPEVVVPAKPKAAPAPAAPVRKTPPSQFIATIRAAGKIYSAWESFMVRRDWGDGISAFQFVPAEGAYGPNGASFKLQPEDPVEIWLNNEKAIQGRITNRSGAFDSSMHQVVVSGKSITDALVQSSIPVKPGSFDGSTIEQAVRGVLAPHKIGLVMKNAPAVVSKPFDRLAAQYGEKVAEFIERIREIRGLFVCDDADGNLVLGQGDPNSAPVADLVEGRNIKSLSFSLENSTAFGKIAAVSQTAGSDSNYPPRAISATATNPALPPERLDLFLAPHPGDAQDLAALVNHRQSQSILTQVSISVVVVGWYRPDGKLWQPTDNVTLYSPMVFPNATSAQPLGIQSVIYSQDANSGSITTLALVLRNGLSNRPLSGVSDASGNSFVGTATNTSTSDATPDAPDYMVST